MKLLNSDIVKVGNSAARLTGVGTEYLVVGGTVLAKFWNGRMVKPGDDTQTIDASLQRVEQLLQKFANGRVHE